MLSGPSAQDELGLSWFWGLLSHPPPGEPCPLFLRPLPGPGILVFYLLEKMGMSD